MSRKFQIPNFYKSDLISAVKNDRRDQDHYKKDLSPTIIDAGPIRFKIARHFGFCFGVENAIEITYRAIEENPERRIFLLSEMIHNPRVNADLHARGVRFIMDNNGEYLISFRELTPEDIVIIPAFGTTLELQEELARIGIDPHTYNATCPFVQKVWKRSGQLGERGYTVIIHGKHYHEETRATFSHAHRAAPSLIIRDLEEAHILAGYIRGENPPERFGEDFPGRASEGFDPRADLNRIGVVNQTTMLATETKEISEILHGAARDAWGDEDVSEHFADTRDTLCYATAENQGAVTSLIASGGDLAIIVGGYNSSNTSHLVELCQDHMPAYYIKDADEIIDRRQIRHLDLKSKQIRLTDGWLVDDRHPLEILLTAGASCPDVLVEQVLKKITGFYGVQEVLEQILRDDMIASDHD